MSDNKGKIPPPFGHRLPQLAEVFGITQQQVRNLVKNGMPQAGPGLYDSRVCFPWRVNQLLENVASTGGDSPRDALAIAQRAKIELETAQLRGTLLPRDLVNRAMNQVAALVASQLDGLAPRLAGELADMSDPQQIQATLLREARSVRGAIAQAMRELGQNVETGEAFDDEEEDVAAA